MVRIYNCVLILILQEIIPICRAGWDVFSCSLFCIKTHIFCMKNYLENHWENVGGMGKFCYLCMLFLHDLGHGSECVEVSKKRVFLE